VVEGAPGRFVLDASALLAYLHEEPGGAAVHAAIRASFVSALNWSEVVQKTALRGRNATERRAVLEGIGMAIVAFDRDDAEAAADLWPRARNLSLADRACLALAARLAVPALTADRAWQSLDLGVEVRLIR
jgi:ribonuclease VapC